MMPYTVSVRLVRSFVTCSRFYREFHLLLFYIRPVRWCLPFTEVAERMLEVDRQMGILYDAKEWETSLREYKKRYYANHPDKRP